MSYILSVRIIWTNIKMKNKFKKNKSNNSCFVLNIQNLEIQNIDRSTFGSPKSWPPQTSIIEKNYTPMFILLNNKALNTRLP